MNKYTFGRFNMSNVEDITRVEHLYDDCDHIDIWTFVTTIYEKLNTDSKIDFNLKRMYAIFAFELRHMFIRNDTRHHYTEEMIIENGIQKKILHDFVPHDAFKLRKDGKIALTRNSYIDFISDIVVDGALVEKYNLTSEQVDSILAQKLYYETFEPDTLETYCQYTHHYVSSRIQRVKRINREQCNVLKKYPKLLKAKIVYDNLSLDFRVSLTNVENSNFVKRSFRSKVAIIRSGILHKIDMPSFTVRKLKEVIESHKTSSDEWFERLEKAKDVVTRLLEAENRLDGLIRSALSFEELFEYAKLDSKVELEYGRCAVASERRNKFYTKIAQMYQPVKCSVDCTVAIDKKE